MYSHHISFTFTAIIWMNRGIKVSTGGPGCSCTSNLFSSFTFPLFSPYPFVLPLSSCSFLHLLLLLPFLCPPLLSSLLLPLTWEPDEALMESTGSQHLPHLRRTGRSPLLSVPPRPSLCFSYPSMLLSITAISSGFIRRKPPTLHRLHR